MDTQALQTMIAFFVPSDMATQLNSMATAAGVQNVTPPELMHVTLLTPVFDPDSAGYIDPATMQDIIEDALEDFIVGAPPVRASINGLGRFEQTQTDDGSDTDALVALIDSPLLADFVRNLQDTVAWRLGRPAPQAHGFTPHITLAYVSGDSPTPTIDMGDMETVFTQISLAWGDQRTDFELGAYKSLPFKAAASKNPDDWAYVPDKDKPSTWKLNIEDATHISDAITAITKGYRGKKAKIPEDAMGGVKDKIRAAIKSKVDKDKQADLIDRLDGKAESSSKAAPVAIETWYTDGIEIDEWTTAVKSVVGKEDDEFEGYSVLWGSPAVKDLTGEFFNADSDLALNLHAAPELPNVVIPALYNHALDPVVKTGQIGTVVEAKADDVGLWVRGQYNKRFKYIDHIKQMVKDGVLAFSSATIPHHVDREKSGPMKGYLKRWPIYEISMTPTPAEPRGTDVKPFSRRDPAVKHYGTEEVFAKAYKSLNLSPAKYGLEQDDTDKPQEDTPTGGIKSDTSKRGDVASDAVPSTPAQTGTTPSEVKSVNAEELMTPEEMQAMIDAAVEAKMAAKAAPQNANQLPPAPPVQPRVIPVPQAPERGTNITVSDDLRYADMSSSDLAFMTQFMADVAAKDATGRTNIGRIANRFMRDLQADPDRTMERRIAAKTFREVSRKEGHEQSLNVLPYKSLDAVDANDYRPAIKANELDTATQSNYVADWVNQLWSQQIILRQRISNPVMGLLTRVDMPTNPFYLPVESLDPTVYYMVEGSDAAMLVLGSGNTVSMSKIKSNKLTLTATKIGARVGYSTEVTEDALPFTIPQFNRQMTRIMHNGIDDTLINGDTATGTNTNVNLIDSTPSNTAGQLPNYLALDGLRKYGLVTNTAQAYRVNGIPTLSAFRAARATLAAQYALDLPNLAYVVDVKTYFKMLSMPEFLTAQNVGMAGSAMTGLLPMGNPDQLSDKPQPVGMIDGIYVYVSAQIGLSQVGAAGSGGGKISNTGSNNVQGTALLIDRSRLFFGIKRGIQVDAFNLPYFSDTQQMLATARIALTPFDTQSLVVMYDITVS